MKITMYELLGLVKDDKAPSKIKTGNIIYELDNKKMIWADEIYHEINKEHIWLNFKHIKSLNDEVEIIEEPQEHKIPEKLYHCCMETNNEEIKFLIKNINDMSDKINEIIDYLEKQNDNNSN